jgi:hypothetical protein
VSLIPKRPSSDLDLQGIEKSVVTATIPDNVKALLKLLPPGMNVQDFLDALGKSFPKLDKDGSGKVTISELTDAMKSWNFPPLDFAGEDGRKLLNMLSNMDPKLQALVGDLCNCKNPEDYAMVNKQMTARVCQLLQAVYKGTPVTIQDISTTDPWKSDDILFNGIVVSLTHQVSNFTDPFGYFGGWDKQEEWLDHGPGVVFDPHVGSDVGQKHAD